MLRRVRIVIIGISLWAAAGASGGVASAAMIVYCSNGGAASFGIQYDGTTLSTGGPQNTPAEFLDFLDWYPDIPTATASISLDGITRSGPAAVFGGSTIIQQFTGGSVSLYDASHALLLSGSLSNSALNGTAGLADGGLFTTTFGAVTGGSFSSLIDPGSFVLQMHLSNINGGAGLEAGPTAPPNGGELQPFTANVTANINGEPVPEPTTGTLILVLLVLLLPAFVPRRRRTSGAVSR